MTNKSNIAREAEVNNGTRNYPEVHVSTCDTLNYAFGTYFDYTWLG